jgi:hypothetical protein
MRKPLRLAATAALVAGTCTSMHLPSALAQEPPPPEPTPPPAAPPPPGAAPEEAPPPPPPAPVAPAAPLTSPTPAFGAPDSATIAADDGADKRRPGAAWVRWRGTALNWSHDVTTTAVGVGRDNIGSEGEVYSQGFGGTFNFFLIDEKEFKLRASTAIGFDVELTDGDTTTKHEPRFRDLPITIATGALTVASSDDDEWSFGFIPNYTTIFPTGPVSRDRGVLLTMSPRLTTFFTAPILGNDAEHLKGFMGGISLRYDRTFTESTVPVNSDVQRPRTDPSWGTTVSDVVSGNRLGDNTIRVGGFLYFEEKFGPSTLQLSGGPSWSVTFLPELTPVDCIEVNFQNTCHAIEERADAPSSRVSAGFGASVTYFPTAEFGVDLSYNNNSLQIGEDGRRRDIFYAPDASFSATLIVSVDAIYERIVGDPREDPVVILGKNTPAPKKNGQTGVPSLGAATF